jgi:hypothetical protein
MKSLHKRNVVSLITSEPYIIFHPVFGENVPLLRIDHVDSLIFPCLNCAPRFLTVKFWKKVL